MTAPVRADVDVEGEGDALAAPRKLARVDRCSDDALRAQTAAAGEPIVAPAPRVASGGVACLGAWVWSLDAPRLRRIVFGLWRAGGSSTTLQEKTIVTTSTHARDELVRVLLMAGCAARFEASPVDGVVAWTVCFAELEASDAMQCDESAAAAACYPTTSAARGELRTRQYTGRTWCFEMPSGFIVTRRAHKNAAGIVTKASRPIVTGNCSAGVGRTGTFIAVAVTIAKLNYASTAAIHQRPPINVRPVSCVCAVRADSIAGAAQL